MKSASDSPLVLPLAALFVAFFVAPLCILLALSFSGEAAMRTHTLTHYLTFFSDPYHTSILWQTLLLGVKATLLCLAFGFPFAWLAARVRARIQSVLLFIVILVSLVVAHEFAHFATAKLFGVRVLEFGIGFPPRARILGRDHETVYTLNWLPLGGFVKLEGEDGDSEDPRSFLRAPLPVRLIVLLAGVAMNVVVALALMVLLAWTPQTAYGIGFASVQPDSPAASIGLQPDDLLVSIDGRRFDQLEPDRFVGTLRASAGKTIELGILRGGAATDGSAAATLETRAVTLRAPEEIDEARGKIWPTFVADYGKLRDACRVIQRPPG